MKRCLDREFVYVKSTDTDIRKTFERIREEQKQQERAKCVSNLNEAIARRKERK